MAIYYLDLESGSDAADGTSFANRVKTWGRASAIVPGPGDTLRVKASLGALAMSVNAAWVNGQAKLTLVSAVNIELDSGESAWTASANVTATTNTATRRENASSSSIAIAAAFTTGLAAYKATGTLDLSAYQQLTFWIQQTTGTLAANCSIRLCSDAAGVTTVNTLTIPALGVLNQWHAVVINNAAALGSSIQSIALYVDTDQAAQTFLLDNICVAKAAGGTDELTHQHLIGKANSVGAGGTDAESWYPIRSIKGTTINLDTFISSDPISAPARYMGATETVTAYTFSPSNAPITFAVADGVFTAAGSSASRLTISGGWNRTDMTTQTGHTIWASHAYLQLAGLSLATSYCDISRLHYARWFAVVTITGESNTATGFHTIGTSGGMSVQGSNGTFDFVSVLNSTNLSLVGINHSASLLSLSTQLGTLNLSSACNCTVLVNDNSSFGIATAGNNKITYKGVTFGFPQSGDSYGVANDSTFGNAKLVRSTTPANTLDVAADGSVTSGGGGGLTAQEVRDSMKLAPTAGSPAAGSVDADLVDIQGRLPASLVSGRIDSSVGALATGVIVSGSFTAGAINATVAPNLDAAITSRTKPADTQARVTLVDTLTTYTGNTPQSGDSYPAAVELQSMTSPNGVFTAAALANAPSGGTSTFDPDTNEIVTGITWTEWARIVGATTASKVSGAGTGTETFSGLDNTPGVVIVTVDSLGNRTAITYNP